MNIPTLQGPVIVLNIALISVNDHSRFVRKLSLFNNQFCWRLALLYNTIYPALVTNDSE